jgi:hypothetical protein
MQPHDLSREWDDWEFDAVNLPLGIPVPLLSDDLSKNQIRKAGRILREYWRGAPLMSPIHLNDAFDVLDSFRAAHQKPLTKATMTLRSMTATVHASDAVVSQRLKRHASIINK